MKNDFLAAHREKKVRTNRQFVRDFRNENVQIQLEIGESDLRNLFRDANSPILCSFR